MQSVLSAEDYRRICKAYRNGLSIRAIARTLHHSRRKIREVLASTEPRPYVRTREPPAPKLGRFKVMIDEILRADELVPRKQRYTAAHIFRRLQREQGYAGGYDQVRRYVRKHRRNQPITCTPHVA